MPTLFAGPAGRVIAVNEPAQQAVFQPLLLQAKTDLNFQQRKSIVTSISVSEQTSQQFSHMLGGDIYVYVFGDRVGQFMIGGLAFAYSCNDQDNTHGIEKMHDWYKENRISKRSTPIEFQIGRAMTFRAFLTSFNAMVYDHQQLLMQYQLGLFLIPEID